MTRHLASRRLSQRGHQSGECNVEPVRKRIIEEWQLGSSVEAQDARGTWYDATVVEERGAGASRELR